MFFDDNVILNHKRISYFNSFSSPCFAKSSFFAIMLQVVGQDLYYIVQFDLGVTDLSTAAISDCVSFLAFFAEINLSEWDRVSLKT